jgi:hypothetical protein
MQLKTSAFQLSIVWVTASLLTGCSGPTANCDDPATAITEYCGSVAGDGSTNTGTTTTRTGGTFIYYRSYGSSYYNSNPARTSTIKSGSVGSGSRSGFGSTGSGRSGGG